MQLQSLYPVVGLIVGVVVGLTGVGGGSLMTPTLVFLFKVPLDIAIGTDLIFASLTKIVGVAAHGMRGNVNWRIVARLGAGSLPASIATILVMSQFKAHGKPLDHVILPVLGFSLVATAAAVMLRKRILAAGGGKMFEMTEQTANRCATGVGVVLGVMVTLTSVGAGAIGVAALMLLYSKIRGAEVVGSDLAHAIPLVTVAGLGHLQLGNIDYRLLLGLLLGSVPGIYIGSTVSSRLPEVMMRRILAGVLLVMGISCIVGG
jgi:uncharacterized membrane protein YfcA